MSRPASPTVSEARLRCRHKGDQRTDLVLIDEPRPHTGRSISPTGSTSASTQGTALTKRTMWAGLEMSSVRAAIEMETHTELYVRLTTKNFEEAVRARKQGRPPVFAD